MRFALALIGIDIEGFVLKLREGKIILCLKTFRFIKENFGIKKTHIYSLNKKVSKPLTSR